MPQVMPTQERLQELFHYDVQTGIFTRKSPSNRGPKDRKYGRVGAGTISQLGYVMIMVDGRNYIAGQLAWRYQTGDWPRRIKYINGNKLDNSLSNIRVHDKSADEIKANSMTQGRLKELLHYEPSTGWFTWRHPSSHVNAGDRAGTVHGFGYRQIGLDYKKYLEHSLAWLYMTGEWPSPEVDHENRNRADNRWTNLRLATRSEQGHNKGLHKSNSLGFPGVYPHGNKYRARLSIDGETKDYGLFPTIAQARIARLLGEKLEFGKFISFVEDRDGSLPLGDKFIAVIVKENMLYVLDANGAPVEVTDVKEIQVLPVTDDGHVIQ